MSPSSQPVTVRSNVFDALPSSVTAVTVNVVFRIDSFAKPAILNSCFWDDADNPFGKLGWILHSATAEHLMVAGNVPFATCIVISVYSSPLESVIVIVGCDWVMTSKQNNRRNWSDDTLQITRFWTNFISKVLSVQKIRNTNLRTISNDNFGRYFLFFTLQCFVFHNNNDNDNDIVQGTNRTMVLVNSVGKQTNQLTNATFTSSHLYWFNSTL